MADDDIIIPPIDDDDGDIIIGDDDIPVIDDDEEGEIIIIDDDDIIIDEFDGTQTIVQRAYAESSDVNELSRSFTEINKGNINFGYRDVNSGDRTISYSISPSTIYSAIEGQNTNGLMCSAKKVKILKDHAYKISIDGIEVPIAYRIKIGSSVPASGYLQVITEIVKHKYSYPKQDDSWLIDWTIERLPFQNGLCISKR